MIPIFDDGILFLSRHFHKSTRLSRQSPEQFIIHADSRLVADPLTVGASVSPALATIGLAAYLATRRYKRSKTVSNSLPHFLPGALRDLAWYRLSIEYRFIPALFVLDNRACPRTITLLTHSRYQPQLTMIRRE